MHSTLKSVFFIGLFSTVVSAGAIPVPIYSPKQSWGATPYIAIGVDGQSIGSGAILDPEKIKKNTYAYQRIGAMHFRVESAEGYEFPVNALYYSYGLQYGKRFAAFAEIGGLAGAGETCDLERSGGFYIPGKCEEKGVVGVVPRLGIKYSFTNDIFLGYSFQHVEMVNDLRYIPTNSNLELGIRF